MGSTQRDHTHSFAASEWPFESSQASAGFTTERLWKNNLPILRAFHCGDGDWQFFSGDIADDDECLMVCLGCIFERDKSIGILGTLPRGWSAERTAQDAAWSCKPEAGLEQHVLANLPTGTSR